MRSMQERYLSRSVDFSFVYPVVGWSQSSNARVRPSPRCRGLTQDSSLSRLTVQASHACERTQSDTRCKPAAPRGTRCAALLLLERKDHAPVLLHVDDGPALGLRLVERLVELADTRLAVIRIFAYGVGVMHQTHEPRTTAGGSPLQHLKVTVGVAEGEDRPAADMQIDADRFAGTVVDEAQLGKTHQHWLAVAHLELHLAAAANDLLRRNTVGFLGPGPHELDAAAGHDEGFEAIRAQVCRQFQHRLINHRRVRSIE